MSSAAARAMIVSERYTRRAVELLGRLRDAGHFRDPANAKRLSTDADLHPLRDREDCKQRLGDLR